MFLIVVYGIKANLPKNSLIIWASTIRNSSVSWPTGTTLTLVAPFTANYNSDDASFSTPIKISFNFYKMIFKKTYKIEKL